MSSVLSTCTGMGVELFGFAPVSCCGAGRRRFCRAAVVALVMLLVVGGLVYGGLRPTLCVRNAAGELVLFSPLPAGQDFCIRFIHSVAKSPVEEWFRGQDGNIVLDRTVYQDFGAGLPHEAGQGQHMEFAHGAVLITGYDVVLPEVTVRVGRVAEHKLLLEQKPKSRAEQLLGGPGAQALPRGQNTAGSGPELFATPRTEGKVFIAVPLRDMAPEGAALTFSVESCFGKYCAPRAYW